MKKLLLLPYLLFAFFAKAQEPPQGGYTGLSKTYPPSGVVTAVSSSPCIPTGNCPPVGDPYIGDCFAGLERYLARQLDLDGLAEMNAKMHNVYFNNAANACQSIYDDYPGNMLTDASNGGYCPRRYCEEIQLAVQLNASIVNTTGPWGRDDQKKAGMPYFNSCEQVVKDINRSYDCAGLRRPIIGVGMGEYVDFGVNSIPIPQYVKDSFMAEFSSADATYYSTATNFNLSRICGPSAGSGKEPNISLVEARMYFFYLATKFIDMGYKYISPDYISNGLSISAANAFSMVSKVRAYAKSKNTFVLMSSNKGDSVFYYNGNLIFDFRSGASRPVESNQPMFCSGGITSNINTHLDGNTDLPVNHGGGIGPYTGCNYDDPNHSPNNRVPFVMQIDYHIGQCLGGPGGSISQYNATPSPGVDPLYWCIWGWDEANYLNSLDTPCQAAWIGMNYWQARSFSHRGFFAMPGRKVLKNGDTSESLGIAHKTIPNEPWWANGYYRMYTRNYLKNVVQQLWTPDLYPSYTNTIYCVNGQLVYQLTVNSINPSTMYTWHIYKPDGTWEPFTYGTTRIYHPQISGVHRIGIRCDNLGYPVTDYGTRIYDAYFNVIFNCPPAMPHHQNNNGSIVSDEIKKQLISQLNENAEPNSMKYTMDDEVYLIGKYVGDANSPEPVKQNINDLNAFSLCTIYPNPANKTVNVSWNEPIHELVIVDVVGRIKKQIKTLGENYSVNNIDISGLGTGIYFMKVRTANNIQTKSFTVQQ